MIEQLNLNLSKAEEDLKQARITIANIKKQLMNAETNLVNCKIAKDKAAEQLRVYKNQFVDRSETAEDIEMKRFKEALPGLKDKI